MPRQSTKHVNHTFGGGWATDYGSTYYKSPEGDQIHLPWLNTLENAEWTSDGGLKKWEGALTDFTTPYKCPVTGSTVVRNIFYYVKTVTATDPIGYQVAVVGNSLFTNTGFAPVLIGSDRAGNYAGYGREHGYSHLSTFNDLLIWCSTNSDPYSWDQTTFQALAGSPARFQMSVAHKGRHWGAGVVTNPSRLYYSVVGNPEDWSGAGSGSIDIDPGDGDSITGLYSWKGELFVFKGPEKLSIHRITGSTPSDFARTPFVYGVSAANQNCIFEYGNDIGFWGPHGSCHSLEATSSFGDYNKALINYPILSWCMNYRNVDPGYLDKWQAITNPDENYTIFNFVNHVGLAQRDNVSNTCIVMDWRFVGQGEPYPRFSRLTYRDYCSVGIIRENQWQTCFGTWDGGIQKKQRNAVPHSASYAYTYDRAYNDLKSIPFRLETPHLTYGPDIETKTVSGLSLSLETNHRSTVTVKWGGSLQPKQSVSLTQPGYTPIGTFVIGTDLVGYLGKLPVFTHELSGDFVSVQYDIIENTAYESTSDNSSNGLAFNKFGVTITPTGESTENL